MGSNPCGSMTQQMNSQADNQAMGGIGSMIGGDFSGGMKQFGQVNNS